MNTHASTHPMTSSREKLSAIPLIAAVQEGDDAQLRALLDGACNPNEQNEAHHPALLIAARHNRVEAARLLLAAGADVNAASTSWETPLFAAAAAGHEELFSLLLAAGADIHCHTKAQSTLLHAAANGGSTVILSQLLEPLSAKLNARQRNGDTPLLVALQRNNTEAVRLLLEAGANPFLRDSKRRELTEVARSASARALLTEAMKNICAELPRKLAYHEAAAPAGAASQKASYEPPPVLSLYEAIRQENEAAARKALAAGEAPNQDVGWYDDWTLLHMAAERGLAGIVRAMLESGANPNVVSEEYYDETPLHAAAYNGDAETVRALLEAGANPEARLCEGYTRHPGDDGTETPLEIAISRGHTHAVRALLHGGANIHGRNSLGTSPLLRALLSHHMGIAMEIAALAPDELDAAGPDGITPLISCVRYREAEGLQQLLALGAHPDAVSAAGNTALHEAIATSYEQGIELLLSGGAAVDIANARGETPLHLAARRGDIETARALLLLGADAQTKTVEGKTARELASRPSLLELLP